MLENSKIEASTKKHYTITDDDLPLCCPTHEMRLYNSHPRVYLPIEESGCATCPYCGAEYRLAELEDAHSTK